MVTTPFTSLLLLMASAGAATAAPPVMFELNTGESHEFAISGKKHRVRLISFAEKTEPYFEPANKRAIDAVVEATVTLEVDGKRGQVVAGPFRLPTVVNGLSVLITCTRGWTGGVVKDDLAKDVRLEAQDAALPWYPEASTFPIPQYRWRAVNYQHTFLGLAVGQQIVYYHRGEDFGMLPDRIETVAVGEGEIAQVPGPNGDGASNSLVLSSGGVSFRYAHMNTPNILPALKAGVQVKSSQKLGLTGNTWRGKPVRDPHLHVEMRDPATEKFRNSFPWIVAAYQKTFPGELMPIAGGWRHLWAGDEIELDGSRSLAGKGRKIVSWHWTFTDGTTATGPRVKRVYSKPGTYTEQLTVRDDRGQEDFDFVEVFVLGKDQQRAPSFAMLYYYPVRGVRAGDEVLFDIRQTGAATIDYGDGHKTPWSEITRHKYAKAGTYVVSLIKEDTGVGPSVFRVRVKVE